MMPFFFFFDKSEKFTRGAEVAPKGSTRKRQTQHNNTPPTTHTHTPQPLNHITKVIEPFSKNNLVSNQSKKEKHFHIFHTTQNKQDGAASYTFFLLFPTKPLLNSEANPEQSPTSPTKVDYPSHMVF